jgi:hypothetical protein
LIKFKGSAVYPQTYTIQSLTAATFTLDSTVFIDTVADRTSSSTLTALVRAVATPNAGDQWFATYYDQYGGQWNTTTQTVTASVTADAASLQASLRSLPNRVLDDVTVSGYDGSTYVLAAGFFATGASSKVAVKNAYEFVVTFQGTTGTSGSQFLLEVEGRPTGAGITSATTKGSGTFPVSSGLMGRGAVASTANSNYFGTAVTLVAKEGITGKTTLDRTEASTCAGRGLCDEGTGLCKCFTGFRGLACEFQEALV